MIESVLSETAQQHYQLTKPTFHPIIQEDWRQLYQITQPDTNPWLLRAYHHPNSDLRQRRQADILKLLDQYNFPAPRLVKTKTGASVVEAAVNTDKWHIIMVTFIEGEVVVDDSPQSLGHLATALGQLHALSTTIPNETLSAIPDADFRNGDGNHFIIKGLIEVADNVPVHLQTTYDEIVQILRSPPNFVGLPTALLHNDCVPGNAVMTPNSQLILIDWADSGLGEMVAELGWLLVMCDGGVPRTPPLQPDTDRLYAIIDGYCRHRVLTKAESQALLAAIRWQHICFVGLEMASALRKEVADAEWEMWWARYQVAPTTIELAQARIESHRQDV